LVNTPGVAGKSLLQNLYDISTKIHFMNLHGIDIPVFSLGYPWLDFLTTDDERAEAGHIASSINEKDGRCMCSDDEERFTSLLCSSILHQRLSFWIRSTHSHRLIIAEVLSWAGFACVTF
jgi:hypothetical protein